MQTNNSIIDKIYHSTGRKVAFDGKTTVYNLGAGRQDYPGVTAVDWIDSPNVTIKHDLNVFPWPIPDNSGDTILTFHFLEHVDDLFKTFEEVYRISKNGTRILIEVPHFRSSSAYKDPTHQNFFTAKTINYFCKENHTYTHLPFKFKLVDFYFGWPPNKDNKLKRWFKKWLNKHKDLYDNVLYFFLQAKILVMELEVEK